MGGKPGDLIESNIILNLTDPCVSNDPSWVIPGKTVFPWWIAQPPVPSRMTTGNQKYYIDHLEAMIRGGGQKRWKLWRPCTGEICI